MEISLIVTIALVVIVVAVTAGLWAARRTTRPVLMGLGLALASVGLYLTQLTRLAINGILSIVDWAQRTPWSEAMTWGAGLLAAGIVLLGIGAALKSGPTRAPRETARPATPAPGPREGVSAGQRPSVTEPKRPTPKPAADKHTDPEDAEIEAILRKRGIM